MSGVEAKAVSLLNLALERSEHVGGDDDHVAAGVAHQMVVNLISQVVHGRSVTEVDMGDHAQVGQGVEAAIDGRGVDVRVLGSHRGRQLFGGDVPGRIEEGAHDGSPRGGHPSTARPEQAEDALEATLDHGGVTYRRPGLQLGGDGIHGG